ncbi:MAG: class I SAM-dependent methyltransferase [archaeon]
MNKRMAKLLEKIECNGRLLFLGKPDAKAIEFLSAKNMVTAVFTKINEKNLVESTVKNKSLKTIFLHSFEELKEEFDSAVVFHEDFLGKEETEKLLLAAGKKTRTGGKIFFVGKTSRGAKNFQQTMKELFGNSKVVSVKSGIRLIASVKEKGLNKIEEKKEKQLIEFSLRNKKFVFASSSGVFSKNSVDEGTGLLLENLNNVKEKKILDFGCGLGVIGIVLAKENPEAGILLIDSDSKAVELTKKNIELNEIKNAKTVVSDGFSQVKEKFDLIASNPPTHEKRIFLEKFVSESHKRLEKNGKLFIVLNKKVFLEKELKQVFGNCEIIAEGKKHKVILAEKK